LTVDGVWLDSRGRILVVRRASPPFVGHYALPGGFVEPNESVEVAVAREVREETGLLARPKRLIGVYSRPGRDPRGPTATAAFLLVGRAGRPRSGSDARDALWVPVRKARPMAFDHEQIVRDATRRRAKRDVRMRSDGSPSAR
jgi:8-oxo-dGTP diphosphatase